MYNTGTINIFIRKSKISLIGCSKSAWKHFVNNEPSISSLGHVLCQGFHYISYAIEYTPNSLHYHILVSSFYFFVDRDHAFIMHLMVVMQW